MKRTLEFLRSTPVSDVLKAIKPRLNPPAVAYTHTSIGQAMQILSALRISSLPVLQGIERQGKYGDYLHVLDVDFLCKRLAHQLTDEHLTSDEKLTLLGKGFCLDSVSVAASSKDVPIDDLNVLKLVDTKDTTLFDLINQFFVNSEKAIHRVAFRMGRTIVRILSMLDILTFVSRNRDKIEFMVSTATVKDMSFLTDIWTIPASTPAYEAFRTMAKNDLSALGVVDENGVLISSISNSDVRELTVDDFSCLKLNVLEYRAELATRRHHRTKADEQTEGDTAVVRVPRAVSRPNPDPEGAPLSPETVDESEDGDLEGDNDTEAPSSGSAEQKDDTYKVRAHDMRAVTVSDNAELQEIISTFIDAHVHHVFIVDSEGKPVGLVSPTDCLRYLLVSDVIEH